MTMDCTEARMSIVSSYIETLAAGRSLALAAHCEACPACATFAGDEQTFDERLMRGLAPGEPRQNLRREIIRRAAATPLNDWRDGLPEMVHFVSWGVAIAACALLVPVSAPVTVGSGLALAIGSYFALAIVRTSLEESPV
jgi:hypothetical protein